MPAGRIFVAMLVCLLFWGFLFAPTMKRAAEASPDGARRSAALAFLSAANWAYTWLAPDADTDALADRFYSLFLDGMRGYSTPP